LLFYPPPSGLVDKAIQKFLLTNTCTDHTTSTAVQQIARKIKQWITNELNKMNMWKKGETIICPINGIHICYACTGTMTLFGQIRGIERRFPVPGICNSHTQSFWELLPDASHFPRLLIWLSPPTSYRAYPLNLNLLPILVF
jgi:hypothetical protein